MWDVQLAALGADIMERRARFMEGLSGEAARIHSVISGGERLRLEYVPSVKPDPDAEQAIRCALKADVYKRQTQTGSACCRSSLRLRRTG